MLRRKSKKEQSRHNLAQLVELQALESGLQDPLPPIPQRLAQDSSRSPPVSSTSHSEAATQSPSRLFPEAGLRIHNVIPDHVPRPSDTDNSEMTRLDDRLATLDDDLSALVSISSAGSLSFIYNPSSQEIYHRLQRDGMAEPNAGRHALLPRALVNQHFLSVEFKLCSIYGELQTILSGRHFLEGRKLACEKLMTRVENALIELDTVKEVEWHRQRPVSSGTRQPVVNAGAFTLPFITALY